MCYSPPSVTQLTSVKVEKKMNRFDRADSPTEAVPCTPGLSSSAQSPQSSMLPSTSASTVDEPVHSDPKPAHSAATEAVNAEEPAS